MSFAHVGIGICLIGFLLLFFIWQTKTKTVTIESMKEKDDDDDDKEDLDVLLVIARYNEDLDWLKEAPFNQFKNIIYNKGVNDEFYKSEQTIDVVNVDNVGRCDHTYLYHVVNNYDNLSNIIVFLPGSVNMEGKHDRAKHMLNEISKSRRSVFIAGIVPNVKEHLNDFNLYKYRASFGKNSSLNPEEDLALSELRPFGKWFEKHFGNIIVTYTSTWSIFSVSRSEVLQRDKSFYNDLLDELAVSSNPEVGHYIEKCWSAVFYPMTETKFIEGFV